MAKYSAKSKAGVEAGLDKLVPFVDHLPEWKVGGSEAQEVGVRFDETPLQNENRATSQPETLITDNSHFQSSNGNDVNSEDRRLIGTKAAKRAKAHKKLGKGDASSEVSESIHAGFNDMMQTSRSNWEFFMKQSEEQKAKRDEEARVRDEEEKQALEQEKKLSMKATRSTILQNIAAITRDLLGATRELQELADNATHDPTRVAEYIKQKALVEDSEHQL